MNDRFKILSCSAFTDLFQDLSDLRGKQNKHDQNNIVENHSEDICGGLHAQKIYNKIDYGNEHDALYKLHCPCFPNDADTKIDHDRNKHNI